jgi:hypothetical protein
MNIMITSVSHHLTITYFFCLALCPVYLDETHHLPRPPPLKESPLSPFLSCTSRVRRPSPNLLYEQLDNSLQLCGVLVCSVSDTGYGISAENIGNLFKEGMQINVNKLQAGGGSGLGLWISRGIVELHGGTLTATSEGEGKGCTFEVRLPVYKGASAAPSVDSIPPPPALMPSVLLSDMDTLKQQLARAGIRQVLVVDDAALSRKIVCRLLSTAGCQVLQACDGEECVRVMTTLSPGSVPIDLILMDYEMPRSVERIPLLFYPILLSTTPDRVA